NLGTYCPFRDNQPSVIAAICCPNDYILSDIDKSSCQITLVRSLKRCICQTFSRSMRRNEIGQNRRPFSETGLDRQLDNPSCWVRHQTSHSRQLGEVRWVASRS